MFLTRWGCTQPQTANPAASFHLLSWPWLFFVCSSMAVLGRKPCCFPSSVKTLFTSLLVGSCTRGAVAEQPFLLLSYKYVLVRRSPATAPATEQPLPPSQQACGKQQGPPSKNCVGNSNPVKNSSKPNINPTRNEYTLGTNSCHIPPSNKPPSRKFSLSPFQE